MAFAFCRHGPKRDQVDASVKILADPISDDVRTAHKADVSDEPVRRSVFLPTLLCRFDGLDLLGVPIGGK